MHFRGVVSRMGWKGYLHVFPVTPVAWEPTTPLKLLPDIERLLALRDLGAENNNLTGSIPKVFSEMHWLEILFLNFNQLSGPFPTGLASLARLRRMDLTANLLDGSFPGSIHRGSRPQKRQFS